MGIYNDIYIYIVYIKYDNINIIYIYIYTLCILETQSSFSGLCSCNVSLQINHINLSTKPSFAFSSMDLLHCQIHI